MNKYRIKVYPKNIERSGMSFNYTSDSIPDICSLDEVVPCYFICIYPWWGIIEKVREFKEEE